MCAVRPERFRCSHNCQCRRIMAILFVSLVRVPRGSTRTLIILQAAVLTVVWASRSPYLSQIWWYVRNHSRAIRISPLIPPFLFLSRLVECMHLTLLRIHRISLTTSVSSILHLRERARPIITEFEGVGGGEIRSIRPADDWVIRDGG